MKIAVASADGVTVTSSLPQTRCVLVFPVEGDRVGQPERRLPDGSTLVGELVSLAGLGGAITAAASPEAAGTAAPEEDLSDDLLREMLDCQVVLVGRYSEVQHQRLRRLGLLPLAALAGERAEVAVRFVVSGNPPEEGEACGSCPNRVAAPGRPSALETAEGIVLSPIRR